MIESEVEKAIKDGNVQYVTQPVEETPIPAFEDMAKFTTVLEALRRPKIFITEPPTSVPRSLPEQIQFFDDGTTQALYLYFNNEWHQFSSAIAANPFSLTGNYFPLVFNGGGSGGGTGATITYKNGGVHIVTFASGNAGGSAVSGTAVRRGYDKAMKARFFLNQASCQNSSEFGVYAFADDAIPDTALNYIGVRGTGINPSTYVINFRSRTTIPSSAVTEVDVTAHFPSIGSVSPRDIMIEFNPGVDAKLYLNGVLIATITTNLPSPTNTTALINGLGVYSKADGSGNSMTIEVQNAHGYVAL